MNNAPGATKRRILIFSLAYHPHVGGAEIALKELTDRMSDFDFHLITLRFGVEPREERVGQVLVHRIGNGSSYLQKILFIPRAARLAAALHRLQPFDAFWAMMSYMLFPIVLLRIAGVKVPYLLTLQEGDPWEQMFTRWFILPLRPLLSYGFRHAAVISVISTYLGEWPRRMGYRGRVEVVPNGADMERFSGSSRDAQRARKETVLVTTSRLVHKNAVDTVIRSLPLLPDIRFRIYGTGPEEASLRALAKDLAVEERVEFCGQASHEELPDRLRDAGIFVRPSRSEGMGNAFIEAMAAGLPVIGTREGGIADFLFDGETGWVVQKNHPQQIAAAVQDILSHPQKRVQIVENAKKLVREKYDWDDIAERMHTLLQETCHAK